MSSAAFFEDVIEVSACIYFRIANKALQSQAESGIRPVYGGKKYRSIN